MTLNKYLAQKPKTVAKRLGLEFTKLLIEEIGRDNVETAREENGSGVCPLSCYTHEFCDANVVMSNAFLNILGHDVDAENQDDVDLWNASWEKSYVLCK